MKKRISKSLFFVFATALLILFTFPHSQYPTGSDKIIAVAAPTPNTLPELLQAKGITNPEERLSILINKSGQTLTILLDDQPLKKYRADFGDGGMSDKQIAGDHKTPEGTFYVCEKSILSPADKYLGSRWMRLSYPNIEDASRGLHAGTINQDTFQEIVTAFNQKKTPPQRTALGGGIGIHGGSITEFGSNWTWGCIGLTNKDIEEFYDYISVGTPVIIQK